MTRRMNILVGAVVLLGMTTLARSADAPELGILSGYGAIASDYRFRGISQSNRAWATQAQLNWSISDGYYAGTWISKTNWNGLAGKLDHSPTYEVDLYAGKHFDLGGSDLNVEAYYYAYPDARPSVFGTTKPASYVEGIFQLSHTFGALALTATGAVSPELSFGGGTGGYVEGTASYPLADWLTLSGNIGHQWAQNAPSDYSHFDLGLTASWRNWSLDMRGAGTDLNRIGCLYYINSKNACTAGLAGILTYTVPNVFGLLN